MGTTVDLFPRACGSSQIGDIKCPDTGGRQRTDLEPGVAWENAKEEGPFFGVFQVWILVVWKRAGYKGLG